MARNQSALVNWSQYLALRAFSGTIQCFDVQHNLRMAAAIGAAFHGMNRKRAARAEQNIAISFPDWPDNRVKEVARQSMQHMFQMFMVDALVTPRLVTPATWSQ